MGVSWLGFGNYEKVFYQKKKFTIFCHNYDVAERDWWKRVIGEEKIIG